MRSFLSLAGAAILLGMPITAIAAAMPVSEINGPKILGYVNASTLPKTVDIAARADDVVASPSLNLGLIEAAAAPPSDIDISQDYAVYDYNFLRNPAWNIAKRDGKVIWVHDSRLYTLRNATETAPVQRRSTSDYWLTGASTSRNCPSRTDQLNQNTCYKWLLNKLISNGLLIDVAFVP
ncbi:hypothetical protein BDV12DRAFT_204023 [Aspergillus spectabilis]